MARRNPDLTKISSSVTNFKQWKLTAIRGRLHVGLTFAELEAFVAVLKAEDVGPDALVSIHGDEIVVQVSLL